LISNDPTMLLLAPRTDRQIKGRSQFATSKQYHMSNQPRWSQERDGRMMRWRIPPSPKMVESKVCAHENSAN
jgi:hypothetical protein